MMEFLSASQNLPFGFALGLMFAIAFLEGVGTIFGIGFSGLLDEVFPDIDIDVDAPDVDASSGLTKILGWLRVDKVPILVLFIIFLTSFGIVGYGVQVVSHSLLGFLLPSLLASIIAFFVSLPVLRVSGGVIGNFIPKDETSAVSEATFVGRTATITMGVAKVDSPVQARLQDEHGKTHYVMVEPDNTGEEFKEGEEVLLVKKEGTIFKVINDTTNSLVN